MITPMPRRSIAVPSAVLLVVLALSACSSSGKAVSPSTSTSISPSTTTSAPRPTPSVHIITKHEAAQHYLKIVAPSNAAQVVISKIIDTGNYTFAQVRAPLTSYVTSLDKFARELLAYPWPASVKPIAARLAAAILQDRIKAKGPLYEHSDEAAMQVWNATTFDGPSTGIATEMRIALGLPSN